MPNDEEPLGESAALEDGELADIDGGIYIGEGDWPPDDLPPGLG